MNEPTRKKLLGNHIRFGIWSFKLNQGTKRWQKNAKTNYFVLIYISKNSYRKIDTGQVILKIADRAMEKFIR